MANQLASFSARKAAIAELVRPLLNQGATVKWSANPDNSGLVLSTRWRDVYGSESIRVLKSGWIHTIHPADRLAAVQRWLRGRLSEQPYQTTNLTLVHGVYRPVRSLVFPIRDHHGTVIRWEGYNQVVDDNEELSA